MINKTIIQIIFFLVFNLMSEPTINFIIDQYPLIGKRYEKDKLIMPGYTGYKILKSAIPFKQSGIPCLYAGTISFSDDRGLVRFIRSNKKLDFMFVVSENIKPIFLVPWVIDHWEVTSSNAKAYKLKNFTDKDTQVNLWQMEAIDTPKTLPNNSIIIFAPKDKIYVPEGVSINTETKQIFLPNVFSKIRNYEPQDLLKIMNIKQFFAPVKEVFNKENKLISQINS